MDLDQFKEVMFKETTKKEVIDTEAAERRRLLKYLERQAEAATNFEERNHGLLRRSQIPGVEFDALIEQLEMEGETND